MYTLQVENLVELSKLNKLPPELLVDDLIPQLVFLKGVMMRLKTSMIFLELSTLWHKFPYSVGTNTRAEIVLTHVLYRQKNANEKLTSLIPLLLVQ